MDFQQPHHRYMRPPPPPMADPSHNQPLVPPPPGPSWFSGQFQYHHHSPSPPPPHHNQQWAPPPPPSNHLPPVPYSSHHQYPPPPRPHLPPPHPHSQLPQSYPPQPQVNQDWQNPNWGYHQGFEYPAHNNAEDWAAKARAWAAAKNSSDDQYSQPQFTPVGRLEEHRHYLDQYPGVDPHSADVQHQPLPASSYQQYPSSVTLPYRAPESPSFSSGYVQDGRLSYTARNGTTAGDANAAFPRQQSSPTSLSVHQQEVPSSYSSIAGKEVADQNEKFYQSPWPFDSVSQQHAQPPLTAVGRSVSFEQTHYTFGNQSAEPTSDLSDQPLDFVPRFSHDHDRHVQPNYAHDSGVPLRGIDSVTAMPSVHAWTSPAAPGVVYPPVPPVLPSGLQVDSSVAIPSPVPGHSGHIFGRMPGQNFQQTIPSVSAPFGVSSGPVLHPTSAFPGDAYGSSIVSDRPKKASVPNWLREEIIKKKAVIATSAPELSEEETKSFEEEGVDRSLGNGDLADRKSNDSSRSTEEEDDEEDYVEAARTAAINNEIKRVLTEVLLKVTDELFDEIATKVLNEDDLNVEVDHNVTASKYKVSAPTPELPTPKASAKVLIAAKTKDSDSDVEKYTSSAPGDVLGLANYASDDDEDGETQYSGVPNSKKSQAHQPSTTETLSDDIPVVGAVSSQVETEKHRRDNLIAENHPGKISPNSATVNSKDVVSDLNNDEAGRASVHGDMHSRYSSMTDFLAVDDKIKINDENMLNVSDGSLSKESVEQKDFMKSAQPVENFIGKKSITNDTQGREPRNKPDKNDSKQSSSGKDKEISYARGDESHGRQDERLGRKERKDDRNGSKEKMKEQGGKSGEKLKEADSRTKSTHPDNEGRETEKDRRASAREDSNRKRDRTKDEKGERSRHKLENDSSKHKRRRPSTDISRGRSSKNNSVASHADDSGDISSDDSRRKVHSKRRNLSPSPVRSRRRQVSRSPHSKHSQRRHSPYSSLESTRGKRSRSRSPARRKR